MLPRDCWIKAKLASLRLLTLPSSSSSALSSRDSTPPAGVDRPRVPASHQMISMASSVSSLVSPSRQEPTRTLPGAPRTSRSGMEQAPSWDDKMQAMSGWTRNLTSHAKTK
eukprot:scaffold378441_cov52-Prasinocladus_malaysianus.AAC.1